MYGRFFFVVYLALILLLSTVESQARTQTAGMIAKRHGTFNVHERSDEISVSIPVQYFRDVKLFTLENPDRIVLDITNDETFYAGSEHFSSASPYIKEIRVSHKSGMYRFVCETSGNASLLRYGVLKPVNNTDAHMVEFTLRTNSAVPARKPAAPATVERKPSTVIVTKPGAAAASAAAVDPFTPVLSSKPAVPAAALPSLNDILAPVIDSAEQNIPTNNIPREAPVPVRKPGTFKPLIVLDAGHGGRDPGASGSYKREKNITLAYATYVAHHLRATDRYKARLTRDRDIFIPLRERVEIAEKLDADFFISLHADSLPSKPHLRGVSIYTLSENASDKEAQFLANQENAAGELFDNNADINDDITDALVRLVQRDTMNRSAFFAGQFVKNVPDGVTKLRNTHRFAGFRVLTGVRIPSALIEMGFISNKDDEKMLGTPGHKRIVARTIEKSLDALFQKKASR